MDRLSPTVFILVTLLRIAVAIPDELHAKAAAAIAIHEPPNPWLPPKPPPPPPPRAAARPVLKAYGATWCGWCRVGDEAFKAAKDLPFEVQHFDFDTDPATPKWVDELPAYAWTGTYKGKPWEYRMKGWHGLPHLLKEWKRTQ